MVSVGVDRIFGVVLGVVGRPVGVVALRTFKTGAWHLGEFTMGPVWTGLQDFQLAEQLS